MKDGSLSDPFTIIASLLDLEDAVVKWGAERSSLWDHKTVFDSTRPDVIYDDTYTVYNTYSIAATWNIQRATRIFTHEAIFTQINEKLAQPLSAITTIDLPSQRSRSLAIICETAFDICASVPYLLGHDKSYNEQLSSPAPAATGYLSLPAIYLAGSTVGVPQSMRLYVLGRLRHIGHSWGIQQATMMAAMLQSKIDEGKVEEWEGLPRQFREEMGHKAVEYYGRIYWDRALETSPESEQQDSECVTGGRVAGYVIDCEQQAVSSAAETVTAPDRFQRKQRMYECSPLPHLI